MSLLSGGGGGGGGGGGMNPSPSYSLPLSSSSSSSSADVADSDELRTQISMSTLSEASFGIGHGFNAQAPRPPLPKECAMDDVKTVDVSQEYGSNFIRHDPPNNVRSHIYAWGVLMLDKVAQRYVWGCRASELCTRSHSTSLINLAKYNPNKKDPPRTSEAAEHLRRMHHINSEETSTKAKKQQSRIQMV